MSLDRALREERASDAVARIRVRPLGTFCRGPGAPFVGLERAPKLADEVGAVAVIECVAGGRILVCRGDREFYELWGKQAIQPAPTKEDA